MAYTGRTWTTGEVVTAAMMNTIRDDLEYLKAQGIGEETVYIPVSGMVSQTGAEPGALEILDNGDIVHYGVPFNDSTDEILNFNLAMPKRYDQGTIYAKFFWTTGSGGSSGDVVWAVASQILDDNDAIGNTLTFDSVTDSWIADMDVHITGWVENANQAGSATDDNPLVEFAAARDADNGSDTLSGDAYLLGVLIRWTSDQETDD